MGLFRCLSEKYAVLNTETEMQYMLNNYVITFIFTAKYFPREGNTLGKNSCLTGFIVNIFFILLFPIKKN